MRRRISVALVFAIASPALVFAVSVSAASATTPPSLTARPLIGGPPMFAMSGTSIIEYEATDVPKAVPDGDTTGVTSTINVDSSGKIADLNLTVNISHTWVGDLEVELVHITSTEGRSAVVISRPGVPALGPLGCAADDIAAVLSDESIYAIYPAHDECGATSPAIGGMLLPASALSFFDGMDSAGTWMLNVRDLATGDIGTLTGWTLSFELTEVQSLASDVGLVDPSTGEWYLRAAHTSFGNSFYFGNPGDVPFMGDWDCDGTDTPGLFRQSDAFAYLRNANTQGIADIRFFFGNPSDVPLAGDFDGDGCTTLSLYRPSEQRFYIINHLGKNNGGLGAADYSFLFGNPGDTPVVGDWDGDGIDEVGLYRESSGFFYYRTTLTTGVAAGQFYFGNPGDRFVVGDWGISDGRDTPAVFRPYPMPSTLYFRHTLTPGAADSQFSWGGPNWLPVAGDFGIGFFIDP